MQVNVPTSQQLCQAPLLCVDLEYPEFQNATPEGEKSAGLEDDLGRCSSLGGVPLKALATFLSLERQAKVRCAFKCVSL